MGERKMYNEGNIDFERTQDVSGQSFGEAPVQGTEEAQERAVIIEERPERGRRRRGGATGIAVGAVALLLIGGVGYGTNGFRDTSAIKDTASDIQSAIVSVADKAEQNKPAVSSRYDYVIIVSEDGISYNGKQVTLEELEELLRSDYTGKESFAVEDDYAIKSTYDEVISILTGLEIPYSES